MKIDGVSLSGIVSLQAAKRVNSPEKKNAAGTDNLAVSDKAQVFQTLLQKAKELPAVREEKVQELSQQIERGEYKVNPRAIAENLLASN